ncbi:Uncharacterised protein [Starkeya nomas]|uniref:SH3b domain-containing protein n=1 Tax=Starkeya nomas TaxID=2666134 RepID=A0A5S9P5U2_9HYPH|nr:SH3 domain-containing protein [Starkeya nomas]CAA0098885.1 Uncharacterised protein [Starkeya nomas]
MSLVKSLALAAGLLVAGSVMSAASAAVVTGNVNVRSGPGTNYRVIGSLPAGARVDVGGCRGNWCRVAGGWVSASFLSGGGTSVVVSPDYSGVDDVALGVGAFALGAAVGSAWDGGWGYYGPGWGYGGPWWGPRYGYWRGGPGWRGPAYWRGRPAYWRGAPGWRGRPAYWRGAPGWRGGPAWRGRPAYWGGRPAFRGAPAFRGRPVYMRGGGMGFGRGFGGRGFR